MIRINLLPYREENRRLRRQQFYSFLTVVALAGAVLITLVYMVLGMNLQSQQDRNEFLTQRNADLDVQIKEVANLKKEIQDLIERKNTIESLQEDRSETIHFLSEMVRQVPGGIYLSELTQKDKVVAIKGFTQSSSRVSTLMKNIENSPWMAAPKLNEIRAVIQGGRPLGAFALEFRLETEKPAEETVKGGQQ